MDGAKPGQDREIEKNQMKEQGEKRRKIVTEK